MGYVFSGRCRFCGMTAEAPRLDRDGEELGWFDRQRTCCSDDKCVAQMAAQCRRPVRRKKMTPAEVHEQIKRRGRGARKRRAA